MKSEEANQGLYEAESGLYEPDGLCEAMGSDRWGQVQLDLNTFEWGLPGGVFKAKIKGCERRRQQSLYEAEGRLYEPVAL